MLTHYESFFHYFVGLIVGGWICLRHLFPMIGRWSINRMVRYYYQKDEKKRSLYHERWTQQEDWEVDVGREERGKL